MEKGAQWGGVSLRDPRIPFEALLTLYGVLGFTVLGFNRTPLQMGLIVGLGSLLDLVLHRMVKGKWIVPLSGYITCCSLALLLNYAHASPVLLYPVILAVGSKYALTFNGRHIFNPSMFGVAVSLLTSAELITAAPAYQWANGHLTMSAFIIMAALVLFVFRVGRTWLVVSFLVFYALQTALRAYILRHHLPPETLFIGTMSAPAFFIFTFYMITDPGTSPPRPRDQVLLAFAITVVDLWLHTKESVYTFFYASLIIASARFVFLHAREVWRSEGGIGAWLRSRWERAVIAKTGSVAALGVGVAVAHAGVFGTPADRVPLTFGYEKVEASHSGLGSEMGDVLLKVDPRVLHVAKWVLSVGDGVAVGDFDGDGFSDLFLSHPLKRDEDRAALYRNVGGLRFERVRVPALDGLVHRHAEEGIASGGVFTDYDGDGDVDLLVTVAFGPPRLLRNLMVETGEATFEDVSAQAGLIEHTVALTATFLDFDRDGLLDLFIPNAMPAFFLEYPEPRPFNLFRLPPPEFDGDRRMFRFMHDGWHDAKNGGQNLLYRGLPGGRFEKLDSATMGMPETHWSLAVGTGDFNRDGWTDLYVASDFGPDDLYLNEAGKRFVRVRGSRYGDIGRDTYKGMNVSVADFDRNGWLDVYVSNVHHSLQAEGSLLWMMGPSREEGAFVPRITDEAAPRGALNERRFGWGAAAGDFDNDGWVDLIQANGMVDDRLDPLYEARKDYWYVNHKLMQSGPEIHTYADMWGDIRGRTIYPNEARRAYLNLGARKPGEFVDVAARLGVDDPDNSRGVLLADLDRDGDLDLLVTNQHGPVSLYRNTLIGDAAQEKQAHWIALSLVGNGESTHRAAPGTRVELGGQVRELGNMGGFSAQADAWLHFGLRDELQTLLRPDGTVEVTLHWYGAEPQTVTLEPNRHHTVHQPPVRRAAAP